MRAVRVLTRSLACSEPPSVLTPALAALWWAGKDDWERAHALVMDEAGADCRLGARLSPPLEGDLDNARYWYRQAGRPVASNCRTQRSGPRSRRVVARSAFRSGAPRVMSAVRIRGGAAARRDHRSRHGRESTRAVVTTLYDAYGRGDFVTITALARRRYRLDPVRAQHMSSPSPDNGAAKPQCSRRSPVLPRTLRSRATGRRSSSSRAIARR